MKWDDLCKPKFQGGLGFRNLTAFNKSLLAKQVWRIINYPNSLMARVLKGKYFKNSDVMEASRTQAFLCLAFYIMGTRINFKGIMLESRGW